MIRTILCLLICCTFLLNANAGELNWTNINKPLDDHFFSINKCKNGNLYITAGLYGAGMSTDNGATWTQIPLPGNATKIFTNDGSIIYSFNDLELNPILYIHKNNGQEAIDPPNIVPVSGTMTPEGTFYVCDKFGRLFKAEGTSCSFVHITNEKLDQVIATDVKALNDNMVYIVTEHSGILFSTDKGSTWQGYQPALPSIGHITKFAITNDGRLFFASTGQQFLLEEKDKSGWKKLDVEDQTCLLGNTLDVYTSSDGNLYIRSQYGEIMFVTYSTDDGATWRNFNDEFSMQQIFCLFPTDDAIYLAGHDNDLRVSGFVSGINEETTGNKISITLNIDELVVMNENSSEYIKAGLYDLTGRLLKNAAASGRLTINIDGLQTGLYMLETSSGSNIDKRKILIGY